MRKLRAVHTLIIAARRQNDAGGQAERDKDLRQAGMLFDALPMAGHRRSLADALEESMRSWARLEAGDLRGGRKRAQRIWGRCKSDGWHSQEIKSLPRDGAYGLRAVSPRACLSK